MPDIKILDCTLREGGYVNNHEFGLQNIKEIITGLENSNIDFIECGYLKKDADYNPDKTIFKNLNNIQPLNKKNFIFMIDFGEYDIDLIPENTNIFFRIAFKKHQCKDAINYCRKLKDKGCKIFINPMHTMTYEEAELVKLIKDINEICPYGFTITDSTGSMKEKDLSRVLNIIKNNLAENINLCFHSHNNLQLSFANAQYFIQNCSNRNIIIDSTLSGIGRGAGNLCTEIIALYLKNFCGNNYKINTILETIDTYIKPIFDKNPWGYSIPYYLSGLYGCHPYYAKFLINKNVAYEKMDEILKAIPDDKKSIYDENIIENSLRDVNFF